MDRIQCTWRIGGALRSSEQLRLSSLPLNTPSMPEGRVMSLTIADAYARIKNLENAGQITLPEPQDTVEVGTIDPRAGRSRGRYRPSYRQRSCPPCRRGRRIPSST